MGESLAYRRVLLKLSGEALMGQKGYGLDEAVVEQIAEELREAWRLGAELSVVIGGGNIVR
ncbi:MAG: UMP kinase, partial [Holophagales bacterium]|nr:UMP kinase [Holophagales bacterium]